MRFYKSVVVTLATLSIVPFILATYLNLSHSTLFGKTGVTIFATYGAIILSFLSGIIWGRVIEQPESGAGKILLISSNIVLLSAWCSLLLSTPELSVVLLLLGFITIFWLEARWLKPSYVNKAYLTLHFGITSLVCIMHLLVLYPHY
ncbi:DUF3429 domain-containing protein [Marinomonas foliarum]|uniref:Uncharacterized protein DUF3429 n=1 Tax=Marinomonas foliarum TaxID=491950 RepID=A0A368ZVR9_9GAMM|nr:DUF3429 domain-containing protein [Marinomonas foliarum]RCX00929.1 uncharacterized protein DUF3429 [Marinomonas foliarum]